MSKEIKGYSLTEKYQDGSLYTDWLCIGCFPRIKKLWSTDDRCYGYKKERTVETIFTNDNSYQDAYCDKCKKQLYVLIPDDIDFDQALLDGVIETQDGCYVELDGTCPHGHESPLLLSGLI